MQTAIEGLSPLAYWRLNNYDSPHADQEGGSAMSLGGHAADSSTALESGGSGSLLLDWADQNQGRDSYAVASSIEGRYDAGQAFSIHVLFDPMGNAAENDVGAIVNKNGCYGIFADHQGVLTGYIKQEDGSVVTEAVAQSSDALNPAFGGVYGLVLTFDGENLRLYSKGDEIAWQTTSSTEDPDSNGSGVVVGSWDTSGQFSVGKVSHVALFEQTLSAQDVSDLWDAAT